MRPDKSSEGPRLCAIAFACAWVHGRHTHTPGFTRMAARICLSKHSPLSGSEVGPMGAVSPESLAAQNGLHCALCAGGDLGLQTDQSAGRWWGWKVWKSRAETRRAGMKTDGDANWQGCRGDAGRWIDWSLIKFVSMCIKSKVHY